MNTADKGELKCAATQVDAVNPEEKTSSIISEERVKEFLSHFPEIVQELTDKVKEISNERVGSYYKKVLEYNLPGGKHTRSMIFMKAYDLLVPETQRTNENIRLSSVMGWIIELLQASFLLADDIVDMGKKRRNQMCWHLKKDVGLAGFVDAVLMKESVFYLLRSHFHHLDCSSKLIEIFHEILFHSFVGEVAESMGTHQSVYDFDVNSYKDIAVNKTSYYTFYLPVALAMILAGVSDPEEFQRARKIFVEIGRIFQFQDDYLDCFGDTELSGTVGSDIQESKCTWLAVEFMQRADDKQKKLMAEHYGKKDDESAKIVKQLYEDVGLPSVYAKYEEECFDKLRKGLEEMPHTMLNEVYLMIIERISRRSF